MIKLFQKPFAALAVTTALATSFAGQADTIAITNATIHTAGSAGVLNNATVVISDGKISAINPDEFQADTVVDGAGKVLTPGFIAAGNSLGLVEVG